jgi:hypothetical protein
MTTGVGPPRRVLVTGAEHPVGLTIVRGLGRAGVDVIAGGTALHAPAFRSRYARARVRISPPDGDAEPFLVDVLRAVDEQQPQLILPADIATLTTLVHARTELETRARLAIPHGAAGDVGLDLRATLAHAHSRGVPAPGWCDGPSTGILVDRARHLRPPFEIRPRARMGSFALPESIGFDVHRVATLTELRRTLASVARYTRRLIVSEWLPGITRCVTSVWRRGALVAAFAHERERVRTRLGVVRMVRRSIPLDEAGLALTTALLAPLAWQGVASVEFTFDRRTDSYTLHDIRPRLTLASALALDAGVNLPAAVAEAYLRDTGYDAADDPTEPPVSYRAGLVARATGRHHPWGYKVFCADDWMPAVAGVVTLVRNVAAVAFGRIGGDDNDGVGSIAGRLHRMPASCVAQRSIRA